MKINIEKVFNGYIITRENIKTVVEIKETHEETKNEMLAFQTLCYELKNIFDIFNEKHKGLYLDISITEGDIVESNDEENKKREKMRKMNEEEFELLGTEIEFIPFGNNPEKTVDGVAFTMEEYELIKKLIVE
jgi:hypothetical protein